MLSKEEATLTFSNSFAQFLVDIAEVRAKLYPDGTNAGFRILMNLESYPPDLTRDSFEHNLIEAASYKSIVPTLGGTAVNPGDAYTVPGADDSWLPSEAFSSVVPASTIEEIKFFKKLGVPALDIGNLKKKTLDIVWIISIPARCVDCRTLGTRS